MQRLGLIRAKLVALLVMGGMTVHSEAAFKYMWHRLTQFKLSRFSVGAAMAATQADEDQTVPLFTSKNCPEIRQLTTPGKGWARIEYVREGSQEKCLRDSRLSLIGCSKWLYDQLIYNMAGWGFAMCADPQEYNEAQSRSKLSSTVSAESVLHDMVQAAKKINSESALYWEGVLNAVIADRSRVVFGSALDLPTGTDRLDYFQRSYKRAQDKRAQDILSH